MNDSGRRSDPGGNGGGVASRPRFPSSPILLDREKETYRRWGLGRTTLGRPVFSPTLGIRYLKLLFRGERFLGLAPDMLQLGGDFVVDRRGAIAFAHAMAHNGDRAEVGRLIRELRAAADSA